MSVVHQIQFSDSDVVNIDDWIPQGEYNPYNVRPFLFHNHGFVLGVVFADCLQIAYDELADSGKIDSFMISDDDINDYIGDEDSVDYLGNNSLAYDVENVCVLELPNPCLSFCQLFDAQNG